MGDGVAVAVKAFRKLREELVLIRGGASSKAYQRFLDTKHLP